MNEWSNVIAQVQGICSGAKQHTVARGGLVVYAGDKK